VVINGTCLDFLAESFMAGDPLNGGGFVILNGVEFDGAAAWRPWRRRTPAPTCSRSPAAGPSTSAIRASWWSRASSMAACSFPVTDKDWRLIRPYLEENERLFGIRCRSC